MNLHEYQTKHLFQKYGIPTPPFFVLSDLKELDACPFDVAVLKVQIHAGGRGKAGGIRFAKNRDEIRKHAKELLGMRIINEQTGPEGLVSQKVLITPTVAIKKEYYAALLIDRAQALPILLASKEGGMEIEQIAKTRPESLIKEPFEGTFHPFQELYIEKKLGWGKQGTELLKKLSELFKKEEALLLEINPLVETDEGELLALDAKCSIDENALWRHPETKSWEDLSQKPENEVLAQKWDLAYVGLDGTIGCMVNGAGLAMATMDILSYYGGSPANFLDVGGGANLEKIVHGFKIILNDTKVKSIFVNIFGGIMDCALIAEGIVQAVRDVSLLPPLIVRLEGTNVEKGRDILKKCNIPLFFSSSLQEGAQKAVAEAKKS